MVKIKRRNLILLFLLVVGFASFFIGRSLLINPIYFIVDSDNRSYCEIYDNSGALVQGVALGFCNFFDNGDAVGKTDKGLTYYSNGSELWSKALKIHHDIELSADRDEIFVTCFEIEKSKAILKRHECVKIFDRNGIETFSWSLKDNFQNLQDKLGVPLIRITEFEKSLNAKVERSSHLNFAHEIEWDHLKEIHSAFTKGNILVSDALNQCIFVIGRESQKVEWALSLEKYINDGPHTPHIRHDGKIIFFANTLNSEIKASGIGVYDLKNQSYSALDKFSSEWHSFVRSSIYPIDNEEYLMTFSVPKKAVIVDASGTVLKTLFDEKHSPKNLSDNMLYRVRAQNKNAVDQYIKKIGI